MTRVFTESLNALCSESEQGGVRDQSLAAMARRGSRMVTVVS